MIDARVRKLAQVLVHYSTAVKPGEKVLIGGSPASEPLLREVYRQVLQTGAHPIVRLRLSDQDFLSHSRPPASEVAVRMTAPPHHQYVDALAWFVSR